MTDLTLSPLALTNLLQVKLPYLSIHHVTLRLNIVVCESLRLGIYSLVPSFDFSSL
jgi:hypothetical protein